jgi:hypothetical protein
VRFNVRSHAALFGFLVALLLCWPASTVSGAPQLRHDNRPPTREELEMQKELQKQRSKERFEQLKRDTDQLLTLATELKKSVDASREQTLSVDVVQKAEQIEKLAKSVKLKMRGE